MRFGSSSNFAINRLRRDAESSQVENVATRKGVAIKTVYFSALAIASAVLTYMFIVYRIMMPLIESGADVSGQMGLLSVLLIVAIVLTLVCAIACMFSIKAVPIMGSLYAVSQGFLLGVISTFAEIAYPGVVFSALLATTAVFAVMSVLYYSGIVKVTDRFRAFMMVALISAVVCNLLMFVLSLIIPALRNTFYGSGLLSIGISVIMVAIASLMLLIDFNMIDNIVERGMDKKYEWVGAFSLTVTLIWLYMEILRLLIKLRGRR